MKCEFCYHELREGANFCDECGLSTKGEVSPRPTRHSTRKRTFTIAGILALIVILVSVFLITGTNNNLESKLKGDWSFITAEIKATNTKENALFYDTVSYSFMDGEGINTVTLDGSSTPKEAVEFEWHITEDRDLILLWSSTSCTIYEWNPNYQSYNLAASEYSWYLKGDKLYLSSGSNQKGYNEYVKRN